MSKPFFISDRQLKDEYLTPVRSKVTDPDINDMLVFRDQDFSIFINTFKEPDLVFSCRFLSSGDSVTFRLIYYVTNSSKVLVPAGQSATVTVAATDNTISTTSPPGNGFLGDNVTIPMQGAKFAKIQVTAITGEVDILVGKI